MSSSNCKNLFLCEDQVYNLLSKVNIKTPLYYCINKPQYLIDAPFKEGEKIVLKAMAPGLWHKSDLNAVKFCSFSQQNIENFFHDMQRTLSPNYHLEKILIVKEQDYIKKNGLPFELFFSVQSDQCCGPVIHFGPGGIHTEQWNKKLKEDFLIWPTTVYSWEEAFEEAKNVWPLSLWLGHYRQGKALVSEQQLKIFFQSLWSLTKLMKKEGITFLEINPIALTSDGLIALDGIGEKGTPHEEELDGVTFEYSSLLSPKRLAIAGVSSKEDSVGKLILANLIHSKIPKKDIIIIKPNTQKIEGISCLSSIAPLKENPVDILIIALNATDTFSLIQQLLEQGGGAEIIFIVAGGLSDGADQKSLGKKIQEALFQRRKQGQWTPVLIGPNALGMINSVKKLNSMFIPQEKLNISYDTNSNLALISQSGAFLITRLSRHSGLKLKYGFCIGAQLDLKISHFMKLLAQDRQIQVFGVYIEGFEAGDACSLSKQILKIKARKRHVIIYKGGRSQLGIQMAKGHTGAMGGDYAMQERLLSKAGAVMVETFAQFNSVLTWLGAYPQLSLPQNLWILTNAGYESVGSADGLSPFFSKTVREIYPPLKDYISSVLKQHQLDNLVEIKNPLDLTPMADEQTYLDILFKLAQQKGNNLVLLGLVPLTKKLETEGGERSKKFAQSLAQLSQEKELFIAIIIDAGRPYAQYRSLFEQYKLPVFDSMDQAIFGLNALFQKE